MIYTTITQFIQNFLLLLTWCQCHSGLLCNIAATWVSSSVINFHIWFPFGATTPPKFFNPLWRIPWVWSRCVCKYCLVLNIFPQTWHGSQKSFFVWTLAMCCLRLLFVLYIRPHSGHIGFCCWRSSKGEPPSSDTGPGSPGHVYQFEHPPYSKLVSPKR